MKNVDERFSSFYWNTFVTKSPTFNNNVISRSYLPQNTIQIKMKYNFLELDLIKSDKIWCWVMIVNHGNELVYLRFYPSNLHTHTNTDAHKNLTILHFQVSSFRLISALYQMIIASGNNKFRAINKCGNRVSIPKNLTTTFASKKRF